MASKIEVFMYFVVIASFIAFVNGNKCKFSPAAKVDSKKFFENAPGEYKIQLSSKVSSDDVAAAANVKNQPPSKPPKGANKVCFTFKGKSDIDVQCKCGYDNFAQMDCTCYKPDNVAFLAVPDAGNTKQVITKSDDGENYILIEACSEDLGRTKWFVISKGDLSNDAKADIKKFVKEKGLAEPADKKDQFKGEAAEIDDGCANFTGDKKKAGAGAGGAPDLGIGGLPE